MKYICVTCSSEVEKEPPREVKFLINIHTQLQLALKNLCEKPVQTINIYGVILDVNYESVIISIRNKLIDVTAELEEINRPYHKYEWLDKYL